MPAAMLNAAPVIVGISYVHEWLRPLGFRTGITIVESSGMRTE